MICLCSWFSTLLLVYHVTACASRTSQRTWSQPPNYDVMKKEIMSSFKCRGHSGMVISVVKDSKTVFSEAYGVTLPGSGVNVTTDTKFLLASLTKAFSGALLVNVLANNPGNKSYELSTPLSDILGDHMSFADQQRTQYASSEDLLSHRIGLPNKSFMRFNPSLDRKDFIKFARYWKTKLPFRGTARYSSSAYTLVAAITENLGGKSWESLTTERLLKPLGMDGTGFAFTTNFSDDNVAKPYSMYGNVTGPISPIFTRVWNSRCGSGCIMSSANDMTKWMNFILSVGKNSQGQQVLPVSQAKTLTTIRTYLRSISRDLIRKPSFPVTSVADEYALGLRNGYYKGYKIYSHTGSTPGYATMLILQPDDNIGVFIAMNGDDSHSYYRLALSHYILDSMLGEQPWLNSTTLCSFPHPWAPIKGKHDLLRNDVKSSTLPFIDYIGAYNSSLYGEVFVNYNSSTTSLQAFYGIGSWQLLPQQDKKNTFFGKGILVTDFWDMPGFEFIPSNKDSTNITSLVVNGFDYRDPPVFYREFN